MPRPTPARILYLLVGLLLGLAATVAAQVYLLPSVMSALPFGAATPTPVVATGPTQFSGAALERVIIVNQGQDREGVALRLNSLEIYRDGFGFTYTLRSGAAGVSPRTLEPETFLVTDDRNTAYTLSPLGSAAALSAGLTTGMVAFTPAPPAEVQTLRVRVPNLIAVGLRPAEGQSRVVAGPWEFQIGIRS